MPWIEPIICYRFLPRFALVFCPDFVDISPLLCCAQLVCFLFVLRSYFAIQELFSVSKLVWVFLQCVK